MVPDAQRWQNRALSFQKSRLRPRLRGRSYCQTQQPRNEPSPQDRACRLGFEEPQHSDEAMAEAVDASPDEVRTWIEESQRRELEGEANRIGGRCDFCKKSLLFGTEWTQSAGKKYHPACWRKMTDGG